MNATPSPARHYPGKCYHCRSQTVNPATIDRQMEVRHDGVVHTLNVRNMPVERCDTCQNITYGDAADLAVDRALREHLGLLQPEQLVEARKQLGLSQRELAEALGCAGESISRWETGAVVHSRSSDRLLSAYFRFPEVRAFFADLEAGVRTEPVVQRAAPPVPQLSGWRWLPNLRVVASAPATTPDLLQSTEVADRSTEAPAMLPTPEQSPFAFAA